MTADWATMHKPVLSRWSSNHVLYTKFSISEPNGQLVICHHTGCHPVDMRSTARKENVRFICDGCGSRCSVRKVVSDRSTVLGRREFVKTEYPQKQCLMQWTLPKLLSPPPREPAQPKGSALAKQEITKPPKPSLPLRSEATTVVPAPVIISHSTSLPLLSKATSGPLSSLLKIKIPPFKPALSILCAKSTPQPGDHRGTAVVTPPYSTHPSSSGKRVTYLEMRSTTTKWQKMY
ncbi:hypothetical protein BDM02DRAFT_3192356 [Thelephora ganbajun]|uniref:Uncharacterized protein n=1 Tax=Thelephora ganbajun TaxID=370292 RepID=A0ACB6Z1I9_THEGA|nr:hypothetical protein BDM02DRAFT_3192356 [Thelephora ganbajun]